MIDTVLCGTAGPLQSLRRGVHGALRRTGDLIAPSKPRTALQCIFHAVNQISIMVCYGGLSPRRAVAQAHRMHTDAAIATSLFRCAQHQLPRCDWLVQMWPADLVVCLSRSTEDCSALQRLPGVAVSLASSWTASRSCEISARSPHAFRLRSGAECRYVATLLQLQSFLVNALIRTESSRASLPLPTHLPVRLCYLSVIGAVLSLPWWNRP